MRNILILSILAINSLNAYISPEQPIKEQLTYISEPNEDTKFEYGIYFGELLKDHPKYLDEFVKHFKYIPERDVFVIALKKAKIKNTYYIYPNNYVIVDPMKFKKYYNNSVRVLLGEFRYTKDVKFLDKILSLKGNEFECIIQVDKIRKEMNIAKKTVKVVDKNESEKKDIFKGEEF